MKNKLTPEAYTRARRRARDARRRRRDVRQGGRPARPAHAGLLRQRRSTISACRCCSTVFSQHSAEPRPRKVDGKIVDPETAGFSGFVFKIQANMDPRHRDRIAFVRICSGKFERDMAVTHAQPAKKSASPARTNSSARTARPSTKLFPATSSAWSATPSFGIGDTLTEDPNLIYNEIPRFAPECFAYLHATTTSQMKRFREGLDQLLQEGVIQVLQVKDSNRREPLLGAVGPLQFDVVQYRLKTEYGAESRLESANWELARWIPPEFPLDSARRQAADRREGRDRRQAAAADPLPDRVGPALFRAAAQGLQLSDVPFGSPAFAAARRRELVLRGVARSVALVGQFSVPVA